MSSRKQTICSAPITVRSLCGTIAARYNRCPVSVRLRVARTLTGIARDRFWSSEAWSRPSMVRKGDREVLMVIRVDVWDLSSAKSLVERLYQELDGEAVSLDTRRQQVCVDVRRNPDQTLVRALDVVESWLSASDSGPTK